MKLPIGLNGAVILALVLALPAAGWAALTLSHRLIADDGAPPSLRQFIPTNPPRPAPEIVFADGAGKQLSLADFRGRIVLVNLWATWCEPCIREMPSLDRLRAALPGEDLAIVLVSQDRGGDKVVAPFLDKLGLAIKTYLDPKSTVGHAFEVRGLPTSILIDRDGRELGRVEGALEWDGAPAQALLRWYVARGAKPEDEVVKTSAQRSR
ncbi:MAG TPA: TlpA disulfide reductase family protein [Stellaceae bacterium]|jgi:thiol-disulfide isomerase/thioredoxin|nr:TlpA disulfide reductase family protein [Stellaceae bacterium]